MKNNPAQQPVAANKPAGIMLARPEGVFTQTMTNPARQQITAVLNDAIRFRRPVHTETPYHTTQSDYLWFWSGRPD